MKAVRSATTMLCVCALLATGCAGMNPDARAMLQRPSSCDNPQADIEKIAERRPRGGKHILTSLQSFMPPMIVLSLLRDIVGIPYRSIWLDHYRVAFGSYTEKIDTRVAELNACQ